VETGRRYGIHAQSARQVEQTYEQLIEIARRQKLIVPKPQPPNKRRLPNEPLLRCLLAGFVDQLCKRRDTGTLDCDLTEAARELSFAKVWFRILPCCSPRASEVPGRGSENLTLLGLATATKREWIEEMFPEQVNARIEHIFDRTHKRVAAVSLSASTIWSSTTNINATSTRRRQDVAWPMPIARAGLNFPCSITSETVHGTGQSGLCSATGVGFSTIRRIGHRPCLARAFAGLSLVKEAQATHVKEAFVRHLAPEQLGWLDELTPLSIPWIEGKKLKLQYGESHATRTASQPHQSCR